MSRRRPGDRRQLIGQVVEVAAAAGAQNRLRLSLLGRRSRGVASDGSCGFQGACRVRRGRGRLKRAGMGKRSAGSRPATGAGCPVAALLDRRGVPAAAR